MNLYNVLLLYSTLLSSIICSIPSENLSKNTPVAKALKKMIPPPEAIFSQ